MLKSGFVKAFVFISDKLVFIFIRNTLLEHVKLLAKILIVSLAICALIAITLWLNYISLESELWPIVNWLIDLMMSFLDIHKAIFIGVTYLASFLVYHLSEEMVNHQTRRNKIPKEVLIKELQVNTRAVIITMSNSLSLVLKLLLGVSLLLVTIKFFEGSDANKFRRDLVEIVNHALMFLIIDFSLFFIQRFVIPDHKVLMERSEN